MVAILRLIAFTQVSPPPLVQTGCSRSPDTTFFTSLIVTRDEQDVDLCQACDRKLSRLEFVEEFRGFFITGIVLFFYAVLG